MMVKPKLTSNRRQRVQSLGLTLAAVLVVGQGAVAHGAIAPEAPPPADRMAQAVAAPPVPLLPSPVLPAVTPENSGIVGLTPTPGADLGMGSLHPANSASLTGNGGQTSPMLGARWLRSVALPIYISPAGDHWGWLINGWLIPNGARPIAIGQDATFLMVQAERGLYSFPVLELRPDGWFRFQYTPAGTAWAHTAHLNLGAIALTIEPWEEQVRTAAQIKFRKHGLSQPLRSAPSNGSALQWLVAPDSLIRPLAVQGDWMRVEVTQPAQGCTPLSGSTTEAGWMRWRDERQGLLVWFGTEAGCDR